MLTFFRSQKKEGRQVANESDKDIELGLQENPFLVWVMLYFFALFLLYSLENCYKTCNWPCYLQPSLKNLQNFWGREWAMGTLAVEIRFGIPRTPCLLPLSHFLVHLASLCYWISIIKGYCASSNKIGPVIAMADQRSFAFSVNRGSVTVPDGPYSSLTIAARCC